MAMPASQMLRAFSSVPGLSFGQGTWRLLVLVELQRLVLFLGHNLVGIWLRVQRSALRVAAVAVLRVVLSADFRHVFEVARGLRPHLARLVLSPQVVGFVELCLVLVLSLFYNL